ncbi:colorectal mutant cancer protein isoform X2 [Lutzomyia longipalpis]|uniref:colorectal mutant cancer protein isoform X2 n=1 Tax=Lutzomyia longipalpis TaxID=7200 RepID=UPI002483AB83|nr:colorectal mutant cancer protein isoform X2 [Lutzomyia longipalpis]
MEEEDYPPQKPYHTKFSDDDLVNLCQRANLVKAYNTPQWEPKGRNEPENTLKHAKHSVKGKSVSNGQESWGRDSGARDLSPEVLRAPTSSEAGSQITESEVANCSIVDLANKFHASAMSALKSEVMEMAEKLKNATKDREALQKELSEALEEKDRSRRRLEVISAAHESRLTEMHCVIVELSKKLKRYEERSILEEQEPEESVSELSFQEGSVYNSEQEGQAVDYEPTDQLEVKSEQQERLTNVDDLGQIAGQASSAQMEVLQEEVLHLRAQVALLQSHLACTTNLRNLTRELSAESGNCEMNPEQIPEDLATNQRIAPKFSHAEMAKKSPLNMGPTYNSMRSQKLMEFTNGPPIAKIAERVKLRKTTEHAGELPEVLGEEFPQMEHLVTDLMHDPSGSDLENLQMSNIMQIERLHNRIEHLQAQNALLSLTLSENKSHCDQLYLLCGQYESNAIALQQALNFSDRTIEAYDVMLALFESRLDVLEKNPAGVKNRQDAENVARHLLSHLESEKNLPDHSLGPWQDASLIYSSSDDNLIPWSKEDDFRLREHISKLKGNRARVQNTTVVLQSPYYCEESGEFASTMPSASKGHPKSSHDEKRMDMEVAVLMQELMNMREDIVEFKFRAEMSEREKRCAEEGLMTVQKALTQLQAQFTHNEALVSKSEKPTDTDYVENMERELVQAFARESRLKMRLQRLVESVTTAMKTSEGKKSSSK